MGKNRQPKDFRNTPFSELKGVSVSQPSGKGEEPERQEVSESAPAEENFYSQMSRLGVKPLDASASRENTQRSVQADTPLPADVSIDREQFLEALGAFDATFQDQLPDPPAAATPPRRMKQLKRGTLQIEASLDLHGLSRSEALARVGHFLDNAAFHQLNTLLIVTGKGAHSAEGPVLRSAVESYLQGNSHKGVLEWGRAPRAHGGDGALVVFLRRSDA